MRLRECFAVLIYSLTLTWLIPQIEDTVNADGDIVLGDSGLLRDVDGDLFKALDILDLVDGWNEDIEPRIEDFVVTTHPLHNL